MLNLHGYRRAFSGSPIILAALLLAPLSPVAAQDAGPAARSMEQGALAMRQGNVSEAEQDFQHAITSAPHFADAYLGLGMAQLREGKLDAATQSLAKASELKPSIPNAHMFRGIALFQMNSLDAAIDQLKEEIKLQPKDTEALTWLGIIEIQAGNPEGASAPLDEAAELTPGDQNILFYQVRAHTLSAQQAFRALYKINPDSWYVHRAQAEIDSEAHQPDKAIEEYKAAIKAKPGDPDLYEALADEEQKVGNPLEATNAYQTELTLHPNDPIALFNLGKIQVETGDPTQGVAYLRQAVEAHASPAPTDFYLGLGLSKLSENEEAATWLERVLTNSPSEFILQSDYYELVRVYQKLNRKADSQRALDELKKLKAQSSPGSQP
jgi:tetratricopeptide (TPR) repeat protein